jgi:hypothetical protein
MNVVLIVVSIDDAVVKFAVLYCEHSHLINTVQMYLRITILREQVANKCIFYVFMFMFYNGSCLCVRGNVQHV